MPQNQKCQDTCPSNKRRLVLNNYPVDTGLDKVVCTTGVQPSSSQRTPIGWDTGGSCRMDISDNQSRGLDEFNCPFQPVDFKFPGEAFLNRTFEPPIQTRTICCASMMCTTVILLYAFHVSQQWRRRTSGGSARPDSPFVQGGGFTNWRNVVQRFVGTWKKIEDEDNKKP